MNCLFQAVHLGRALFLCLLGMLCAAGTYAAPTLSYSVVPEHPKSGIPFRVVYQVSWEGDPGDFAIVPSDPAPVAWGSAKLVNAASGSLQDGPSIGYQVEFVAKRPGAVQIPEFRVAYVMGTDAYPPVVEHTPATTMEHAAHAAVGEEPGTAPEIERTSIEAPPIDVNVGRYVAPEFVLGLAAVALSLSAALVLFAIRVRGARARHEKLIPGAATVRSMVNLARQHRLDGKFYEYYRALAQASTLAAPSVAARKLRERLEHDAQRIGYGALQPDEDELEGALRDLERVLREPSAPKE